VFYSKMPTSHSRDLQAGSKALLIGIFAVFLGLIIVFTVALSPSLADAKSERRITLGQSGKTLQPNCGRDFRRDCVVEGKVTGYQVKRSRSSRKRPFFAPWPGKLVSWSVSLARPTKRDINSGGATRPAQSPFFNQLFGSPSTARISVLRRIKKREKGAPQFKMVRQGPVETLNSHFGTTVHFALEKPLNVLRDQVVALTIPTWAPVMWKPRSCNFNAQSGVLDPDACLQAEKNFTWRASRAKKLCKLGTNPNTGEKNEALRKTRPQQVVGSDRRYGCYYGSNALLYTATVVGKD
jgi:hypothetical protein